MAILPTLRATGMGSWPTLPDFLREVRLRETSALSALVAALSATPEEQSELAYGEGAGPILLELARDLRVPKGARLAAVRCLLEGGVEGSPLADLFNGAGDLVTDPRLGAAAKKLVETGLPAALSATGEAARVSVAAGTFAKAAHSAASAVGLARVRALLDKAPPSHAGAFAAQFALGGPLPAPELAAWKKLLAEACTAYRRAPAAAKRMGLVPSWPPYLPDAFSDLIKEAEKAAEGVTAPDVTAFATPAARQPPGAVAPGRTAPPPGPLRGSPRPGRTVPPQPAPGQSTSEEVGSKKMDAIKRSPFRKAIGAVVEGKAKLPPKPMETVKPQHGGAGAPEPLPAEAGRPRVQNEEEKEAARSAVLPGLAALPTLGLNAPKFDPRGVRAPRSDRWNDNAFEWQLPILPPSEMPPPMRAAIAQGPFAQRLQSLFEDRPEAVERLCAAAEAREAKAGEGEVLKELAAELSRKKWEKERAPTGQLRRLESIRRDENQPPAWRRACACLLDRLSTPGQPD